MIGSLRFGQFAIDDMQIGAADAAGADAHRISPGPGCGSGRSTSRSGSPDTIKHHCAHRLCPIVA